MLDDIYLRLFLKVIPPDLTLNSLDISRLIDQYNTDVNAKGLYGRLVKSIYENNPDTNIGLIYGKLLWPSTLCDLSRLLMTAADLQSSLDIVSRLHYIHCAGFFPVISRQHGKISIGLTFPYKVKNNYQQRFCTETVFSYIINTIRETIDPEFTPSQIHLAYSKPAYSKEYDTIFGAPINYQQALNIIELDECILHKKISTNNPTLHQIYLDKCLDSWRVSEKVLDVEYRTITYIMQHHPESFNSQKLADRLNISVRGLQKRLNKQGGSFSHLANSARKELAKVYLLQKRQSIEFTAEQLGFQTSSGFRRFFKTEFKINPAEFIEQINLPPSSSKIDFHQFS